MKTLLGSIAVWLLLTLPSSAQDAGVIPLEPRDAKAAQETYWAMKAAVARWDALRKSIEKSYLKTEHPDLNAPGAFRFSEDFRFIVINAPEPPPVEAQ